MGVEVERGPDISKKLKQTITHPLFVFCSCSFPSNAQRTFLNPMTPKLLNLVKELGKY